MNSVPKHQADLHKREYLSLSYQAHEVCCFRILKDERKAKKATSPVNFDDAHLVAQLLSAWLGFRKCTFLERCLFPPYRERHLCLEFHCNR